MRLQPSNGNYFILAHERRKSLTHLTKEKVVEAAKLLYTNAWTPLRLESAIIKTCKIDKSNNNREDLKDLFHRHFECLLL